MHITVEMKYATNMAYGARRVEKLFLLYLIVEIYYIKFYKKLYLF